jgi:hypothetical protein
MRHPNVLSVLSPIEESKDAIVFETEPVGASLRTLLKDFTNLAHPPAELRQFELDPFEVRELK